MIHKSSTPPPQPELKQLKDWLTDPKCDLFLRFLSYQEADLLMDAAELAMKEDDIQNRPLETGEKIEEARKIRHIIDFITKARVGEIQWQVVELKLIAMPSKQ